MGSFYEYLTALWHHWVYLMTGGPFVAERIAKTLSPRYDEWASRYLKPATRQKLTIDAAIAGIFVASFMAFNDERTALVAANRKLAAVPGHIYRRLKDDQKARLSSR